MPHEREGRAGRGSGTELGVRVLVVVALLVDVVVHLQLAPSYQLAAPGGVGAGTLFRLQAVAALVAAVLLVLRPGRVTYGVAGVVALSALVPVLLYRYVDVPAF
ncbi:hypothetical protein PU560_11970, partial [Georgenia sp. 10Sc9-8]|nr:hypothetical protein [Georgenia halotolerans]